MSEQPRPRTIFTKSQNCLYEPTPGAVWFFNGAKQLSAGANNAYTCNGVFTAVGGYEENGLDGFFKRYAADANNGDFIRCVRDTLIVGQLVAVREEPAGAGEVWLHYADGTEFDWDAIDAGVDQAEWQTDNHEYQFFFEPVDAGVALRRIPIQFKMPKDWCIYCGSDASTEGFAVFQSFLLLDRVLPA